MIRKNGGIVSIVLKALLEGRTLNRKHFNNGSLHSWISTLRNQRFIPIESSIKNDDGTCDYFMTKAEIARFKDPKSRKIQRAEMKLVIERERQQKIITHFTKFLGCLIEFPLLWGLWDELPFRLKDITREINALLGQEKSVNQNSN